MINLKKLEEKHKKNFEERLKFVDLYVKWLKKTNNIEWSRQQKKVVDA